MDQPIFKDRAWLRKLWFGLPTSVIAVLYEDHLEIQNKGGITMMTFKLDQLKDAEKGTGFIRFSADGESVFLEFVSPFTKLTDPLRLFSSSERKIAARWQKDLIKRGVTVKSRLF